MPSHTLTEEQEREAQELARRIEDAARGDILALARLLVSKPEAEIFGETEFQARDMVHRIGAKAFEVHLAQKKTATAAPASNVPAASRPRSSRDIGRRSR